MLLIWRLLFSSQNYVLSLQLLLLLLLLLLFVLVGGRVVNSVRTEHVENWRAF